MNSEAFSLPFINISLWSYWINVSTLLIRGVSRIFERGGPISLGSLKKGHQILKEGGSSGLIGGGGVQYISIPITTNLAYLDAKE